MVEGATGDGAQKLFERQYGRALDALMARIVQAGEKPLSVAMHQRLYMALNNAVRLPHMWASTRQLLYALFPKLELSTHRFAWVPYLRTMFEQSQTIQDAPMSAACALHVGHLYYLNGEYAMACTWLEQAHAFFAEAKDGRGQAQALNMLAWVALRTDRSGEAAALAMQALTLMDECDVERANSHYTLGEVATNRQEWQEAETHLRRSLHLWESAGRKRDRARGLRNLGPILVRRQAHEEAIACYEQAIALFGEIEDTPNLAMTQMNLGIIYEHRNDLQQAIHLYVEAIQIFQDVRDVLNLAKAYTNMGKALRTSNQYHRAEQMQNEAIVLWRKLGNLKSLCNVLDGLGLTQMRQGQFQAATNTFKEALDLLIDYQQDTVYVGLYASLLEHLKEAKAQIH